MPLLTDSSRAEVWASVMRMGKSQTGNWAATKHQLRDAVNAADDAVFNRIEAFQAAIPEAVRGNGPSHTLLANATAIARGSSFDDASAGIAPRDQSAVILAAYNAANTWLTANAGDIVAAIITASAGTVTQGQALLALEMVCRKRAEG